MSKIWQMLGNIILLLLVLGGASYILLRFISREDEPEPPALEAVRVEAEEVIAEKVVVDEISTSNPVQAQTLTDTPTPVVTTTPSLSSTQPHVKLTSLTRFDHEAYHCGVPEFAPSSDDFLCYLEVKGERQLWLASLAEGLKRPLVVNKTLYFYWLDDDHILYSPNSPKPEPPSPTRSVFLMDIHSGTSTEIGQTTQAQDLQVLTGNRLAFLNENQIQIAHLDLKLRTAAQMNALSLPKTFSVADCPTEPEEQAIDCQLAMEWHQFYHQRYFKVSPDGQKVALLETGPDHDGTLTVIDLQSQEKTVLVKDLASQAQRSFNWSPDSTRLVYTRFPTNTLDDEPELWMVQTTNLEKPQFLLRGKWAYTCDYVTWVPDRKDEVLFASVDSGPYSVYQALNVRTGQHTELFTAVGGWGLDLTRDRANGGYRISFSREGKEDWGTWIATLAY